MAKCYYCGEETSNENLMELDDTFVRVCENCREAQGLNEPTFEHHSFDPDKYWENELKKISEKQKNGGLKK